MLKEAGYLVFGLYLLGVFEVGNLVLLNKLAMAMGAPEWSPWAVWPAVLLTMGLMILLPALCRKARAPRP